MAFKLKDIFGSIKSKTNTSNIKEGMDMKYGTGDFATGGSKAAQRMKPGESQYQYNVRMQRTKSKFNDVAASKGYYLDIEEEDDPMFNEPGYDPRIHGNIKERAAGDLRQQKEVSNYGITEGMSFGEAFAQAGKMGATDKPEDAFSWTNPKTGVTGKYVYDFAKENNEKTKVDKNAGPRVDKVKKKEINAKTIKQDIAPTPGPLDPKYMPKPGDEELDFEDFQRITKPINESMGGVQSSYLGQPIIDPIIKQSMKLSGRGLNKLFKGQPEPEIRGSIRYKMKRKK